jgi:hypothetical protein
MNAGLRWEPYFPLTNDDNHNALFDLRHSRRAGRARSIRPRRPASRIPATPGIPEARRARGSCGGSILVSALSSIRADRAASDSRRVRHGA